jgi:hypothetical protein
MRLSGYSVTVARDTSSVKEWFNSTQPLKLFPDFPSKKAMEFRKKHIKGFIYPGRCNYYIGMGSGNLLFGMLGFKNPDFGEYDLLLKADTTPSEWKNSVELLLYILKSNEVKECLSDKFNREINNCYSKCFSSYDVISRYRKFGELINKTKVVGGYDLGYLFQLGTWSLKEAKCRYIQRYAKV